MKKILEITRVTIHKQIYSLSVFFKFHGREGFRGKNV